MRLQVFFFVFLLLATNESASGHSPAFKDSIRAYLDMRKSEEKQKLLAARTDLEPEDHRQQLRVASSSLTQARIDFHALLPAEKATLSPWEKQILDRLSKGKPEKKLATPNAEALAFLEQSYPKARELSTFEWQVMSEVFGPEAGNAFLQSAFFAFEAPPPLSRVVVEKQFALWINTPSFPILSSSELAKQKSERALVAKRLALLGYQTEEISVSPFIRMEDQAEELQKSLKLRLNKGEVFLISHGSASAVLLRTLDLYPDLLQQKEIRGWLNLNGRLFGHSLVLPSRQPASLTKTSAADRQELEVKQEFLRLQQERLEREAPLGAKFPIVNIITLGGKFRPGENLRESVVPEGKMLYLREGSGYSAIEAALPTLINP